MRWYLRFAILFVLTFTACKSPRTFESEEALVSQKKSIRAEFIMEVLTQNGINYKEYSNNNTEAIGVKQENIDYVDSILTTPHLRKVLKNQLKITDYNRFLFRSIPIIWYTYSSSVYKMCPKSLQVDVRTFLTVRIPYPFLIGEESFRKRILLGLIDNNFEKKDYWYSQKLQKQESERPIDAPDFAFDDYVFGLHWNFSKIYRFNWNRLSFSQFKKLPNWEQYKIMDIHYLDFYQSRASYKKRSELEVFENYLKMREAESFMREEWNNYGNQILRSFPLNRISDNTLMYQVFPILREYCKLYVTRNH